MVAGGKLILDFFPGQIEVEYLDAAARGHHILDGDVVEFEQAGKYGSMFFRDQVRRFEDQAAQFFRGEARGFGIRFGRQAEQF